MRSSIKIVLKSIPNLELTLIKRNSILFQKYYNRPWFYRPLQNPMLKQNIIKFSFILK